MPYHEMNFYDYFTVAPAFTQFILIVGSPVQYYIRACRTANSFTNMPCNLRGPSQSVFESAGDPSL